MLIVARCSSRYRYAGFMTSVGASAASFLPMWSTLDDPFTWLTYLVPGLVMDLAFIQLPAWKDRLWFLASLGALAHATKPLIRLPISLATGFPYTSFWAGFGYPFVTHLLFGLTGGFLGGLVMHVVKKYERRPTE